MGVDAVAEGDDDDLGPDSHEKICFENCIENCIQNCIEIPYNRKMERIEKLAHVTESK